MIGAVVVVLGCAACGSSSDDAAVQAKAASDGAWSESATALGVASWGSSVEEDQGLALTGYDDAHAVRARFLVARTRHASGNAAVRVTSTIQGPAVLEFRPLADGRIAVIQDTFPDHPDASRALDLAATNLQSSAAASGASLVNPGPRALHVLDTPLIGNQEQLVCVDEMNKPCEKPPSTGDTVRDCALGAAGLGGLACVGGGAESSGAEQSRGELIAGALGSTSSAGAGPPLRRYGHSAGTQSKSCCHSKSVGSPLNVM